MHYIPASIVAAHLRRELKAAFPGVKFQVRTRHSTTIDVDWSDGPTAEQVRPLTAGLTLSKGVWGEIVASEPISLTGNKGVTETGRPSVEFLFLNRRYSDQVLAQAEAAWIEATGKDPDTAEPQGSFKTADGQVPEGTVTFQINTIAEQILAAAAKIGAQT